MRSADGPAGRRARLLGSGLDVWEAIATIRDNNGDLQAAASYLEVPVGLLQAAVSYYGSYTEEVDAWIEDNELQAAEAHAAWHSGQAALEHLGCCSPRCSPPRSPASCGRGDTM